LAEAEEERRKSAWTVALGLLAAILLVSFGLAFLQEPRLLRQRVVVLGSRPTHADAAPRRVGSTTLRLIRGVTTIGETTLALDYCTEVFDEEALLAREVADLWATVRAEAEASGAVRVLVFPTECRWRLLWSVTGLDEISDRTTAYEFRRSPGCWETVHGAGLAEGRCE